jgi:hypothetical protein
MLDNKRSHAVNPATNQAWFDLLEDVLAGRRDDKFDEETDAVDGEQEYEAILPENIYGMDKSGFPALTATKQRVIGGAGKKTQHQQKRRRSGEHHCDSHHLRRWNQALTLCYLQRAGVQRQMGPGKPYKHIVSDQLESVQSDTYLS